MSERQPAATLQRPVRRCWRSGRRELAEHRSQRGGRATRAAAQRRVPLPPRRRCREASRCRRSRRRSAPTTTPRGRGRRSPRPPATLVVAGPQRLLIDWVTDPEIHGHDRLADLLRTDRRRRRPAAPVIFAPNHHSHLDTALMVRAVPTAWRPHLVTAAAADYFFDKRWKATLAALALNAIPVDREVTNRKSADLMAGLIEDGWSLVIYPEGGRSPDGWGQTFRGGAAYLAGRTGAPVVPVYIDGTDSIMGKGTNVPKPGRTRVTFGSPLRRQADESTRRFNERIERAVAALADESTTDYWSARRRAAAGHDAVAHRPGVHRVAAPLGPRQPPAARHRRMAQPAEAALARPRLNVTAASRRRRATQPSSPHGHEDLGTDDERAVARRVGVRFVELIDGRHRGSRRRRRGCRPPRSCRCPAATRRRSAVGCRGLASSSASVRPSSSESSWVSSSSSESSSSAGSGTCGSRRDVDLVARMDGVLDAVVPLVEVGDRLGGMP